MAAEQEIEAEPGPSSKSSDNGEKKTSKKPSNSAFKQQRLRAWQPILTASTVLPVFFFVAVVFIPIGIVLIVASSRVQEIVVPYTDCNSCHTFLSDPKNYGKTCQCTVKFELKEAFTGQVYVYYQLTNFYQNHRRYVRSRDDSQLHGSTSTPVSACKPFREGVVPVGNSTQSKFIAPCGAIANSLFNDTIKIDFIENGSPVPLDLSGKHITWKSDRETKFKNPRIPSGANKTLADAFNGFTKPDNWQRNIWELGLGDPTSSGKGYVNEDFIVWMRVAAFPTFRKLYRKVEHTETEFKDGLPKGEYNLNITYNFPVNSFEGTKSIVLSTTSWIGGKNPFLGIAYLTVGCICLLFGFVFVVIHMKVRTRPLRDWTPSH